VQKLDLSGRGEFVLDDQAASRSRRQPARPLTSDSRPAGWK
jgi:hypothetical protein